MRAGIAAMAVWAITLHSAANDHAAPNHAYERLAVAAPQAVQDPRVAPAGAVFAQPGCPTGGYCAQPCEHCPQERFTGWYFSGEVTAHTPSYVNSTFTFDGDGVGGGRLTIGHEGSRGSGFRARYWGSGNDEFEAVELAAPHDTTLVDFRASLLELDWYKRFWFDDSSLVFGAGPRSGLLEISSSAGGGRIEGGGAGAFVELWNPFFTGDRTTFAFVGRGAFSFISGEASLAGTAIELDTTLRVAEASFGVEMRRRLGDGEFVAAALYEAQSWDANVFDDVVLNGAALRFGYHW